MAVLLEVLLALVLAGIVYMICKDTTAAEQRINKALEKIEHKDTK